MRAVLSLYKKIQEGWRINWGQKLGRGGLSPLAAAGCDVGYLQPFSTLRLEH